MDPRDQFRLLASVSLVDGKLDPREEQVLMRSARSLGLSNDDATGIMRELMQGGRLRNLRPPESRREREALFKSMVELAIADGQVTPHEHQVLQNLGPSFGLEPAEVTVTLQRALREGLGSAVGTATTSAKRKTRRTEKKKKKKRVKTGEAPCPSCGASIAFRNTRSVAVVCEYCDTTVAREDPDASLEDLGKISHVVDSGSPIQLDCSGVCFGVPFEILGLLQIEHATGYWNEWYLEWGDGKTGWLGEALGQYFVTFPGKDPHPDEPVPKFEELSVGERVFLNGKRYVVSEINRARATGTQGETPFVVTEGYELPYADLRRADDGFATIDYSEEKPLVFTGRCVRWNDLNLRGYRRFDGWRA